ncbi:MAG TPA: hypothetical protein VGN01_02770 [Acidobacteriaceae bacterium]|jgi:hypothetical protein
MDANFAASLAGAALFSKDPLFIGVAEVASGSRVAVVKNVPYQFGVDGAQVDAAVPQAPYVLLISIAIGFEALLLHGETHPFDVSSSQSNQRGFLGGQWPGLRPKVGCRSTAVEKAITVSGQRLRISPKSLPAMPVLDLVKYKISLPHLAPALLL